MTPLRKKMIKAMELKDFSRHTQRSYIAAVAGLTNITSNLLPPSPTR